MRFLKLFGLMLVVIVVVLGIGILATVEGKIFLASRNLVTTIYQAKQLAGDEADVSLYQRKCKNSGLAPLSLERGTGVINYLQAIQVRFVDKQAYVVEVICNRLQAEPIVVSKHQLLNGIVKVAGSGLTFPLGVSKPTGLVVIEGPFKQRRLVGVMEGTVVNVMQNQDIDWNQYSSGPVTTCEGASGSCCQGEAKTGSGSVYETLDCPGACYPVCLSNPSVVYLNTNPPMDLEDRTLVAYGKKVEVEIGFKVVDTDGFITQATLNYGDGTSDSFEGIEHLTNESAINHDISGTKMHTYICREASCTYQAEVYAQDNDNLSLAQSGLNRVTIRQIAE